MAVAPKSKGQGRDWFDSLDMELEKRTEEIVHDVGEQATKKADLNRSFIDDLFKVWKRFNKISVTLTLEPSYNSFAQFKDTFPDGDWTWRSGFNPAAINSIQLLDKTQDQGRIGDGLKIDYVMIDGKPRLRMTFEYCEGEHYYKYSGWKRLWAQHNLYEADVEKVDLDKIHGIMGDIVKVWYESHLRRNRDTLLKHIKKTYERVEMFSQ